MGKRIECVRFFSTEATHSIWRAVSLISPVADCIVIRSVSFEEAASMFSFFLFTIIFIVGFASCETSLKVPRVVVSGFPLICGRFAHAFSLGLPRRQGLQHHYGSRRGKMHALGGPAGQSRELPLSLRHGLLHVRLVICCSRNDRKLASLSGFFFQTEEGGRPVPIRCVFFSAVAVIAAASAEALFR